MGGFVKVDCGILNSSLWFDRDQRSVFLTAMLMARPREIKTPMPQIEVQTLTHTGFTVPAGWYGFVDAAGGGIIRMDGIPEKRGYRALEALSAPDPNSRSDEFEGRRLARVNGGYVVLNYMKYREHDYSLNGPDAKGYVYYIGEPNSDRVKIGFSKNPWARLSALKTANPRLTILGIERGVAASEEYERHRQFKECAIEREWFHLTPLLVAHIALFPTTSSATGSDTRSDTGSATPNQKQKQRTEAVTTKTTTVASGESKNGKSKRRTPESPSWVVEGREWWKQNVGTITPGHFGRALTDAVGAHGWPQVFDALKCYVEDTKARHKPAKPEWFSSDIIHWIEWSKMPATDDEGGLTARGRAIVEARA